MQELNNMKSSLMSRIDYLLQNRDTRSVARTLLALENEIIETEIEARRLRLKGELDFKVYKTLVEGYSQLSNYIIEQSAEHGLEGDVKSFYNFLRIEVYMAKNQR